MANILRFTFNYLDTLQYNLKLKLYQAKHITNVTIVLAPREALEMTLCVHLSVCHKML